MKTVPIFALLCFSLVANCGKNPVDAGVARQQELAKDQNPVYVPIELNKEFTLKLGQTAVFDSAGLKLTFADLLNESRCPLSLNCIWEGNAQIELHLPNDVAIALNTASAVPSQEADHGNYRIRLIQLTPHPDGGEVDKRKYEATLIVSRIRP